MVRTLSSLCFNVLPAPDSAETKAAANAAENKERGQKAEDAQDIKDALLTEAESVHNKHDENEHRKPAAGKGKRGEKMAPLANRYF